MATIEQEYRKLCDLVTRDGGRDKKLREIKRQAGIAVQQERRAANASEKRALQETYVRSFPDNLQPLVRTRLFDPRRYAEQKAAERRQ